jgi:lysophospholipase L1-like esterase
VRFSPVVARILFALSGLSIFACGASEPDPAVPDATATATATAEPSSATTAEPVATATATAAPASASATAAAEAPPLPKGLKVLIIGDSFAEALGAGLRSKEADSGLKFFLRGEKATFIPEWAGPKRGVAGMLASLKPDVVLIALGGNELAMTTPDIRGPKVKELVTLMGSTPCVWIAPPLWGNKDNGLLGVIHDNSLPCRYYDSTKLAPDLPRGSDKIHPTADGQKKWADYVLGWLRQERDEKAASFAFKPRPAGE